MKVLIKNNTIMDYDRLYFSIILNKMLKSIGFSKNFIFQNFDAKVPYELLSF
jgi:hypothetical protein